MSELLEYEEDGNYTDVVIVENPTPRRLSNQQTAESVSGWLLIVLVLGGALLLHKRATGRWIWQDWQRSQAINQRLNRLAASRQMPVQNNHYPGQEIVQLIDR